MNCGPLSEVIVCGIPEHETQWVQKASAQEAAVVDDVRGMASAQRVVWSMMVKMQLWPEEGGRGPTTST